MSFLTSLKEKSFIKKMRKTAWYARIRQSFPMHMAGYVDDREFIDREQSEVVRIDWPDGLPKPFVGLVRDIGNTPRWTKYRRFLENNEFPHKVYDLQKSDWIEQAQHFDVVIGLVSSLPFHLEEIRN